MEVAKRHPFHSYLLHSFEKGRGLDSRIRDERDDRIDPHLRKNPDLL
jgi:hypothetical protein